MSICTEISTAITTYKMRPVDKKICDGYEAATTEFECLVEKGVVSKRGHRLLPVENKSCCNIEINHSKRK